jgi:hypothetical protein
MRWDGSVYGRQIAAASGDNMMLGEDAHTRNRSPIGSAIVQRVDGHDETERTSGVKLALGGSPIEAN